MPNNSLSPKKNHKWPLIIGGLIILIILIPMVMLGADYMALNADNDPPFSKVRFETCFNDGGTCAYQGSWYRIIRWRKLGQTPHNEVKFWVFP